MCNLTCISQNFDICALRSGQTHDIYIISLWEKMKCFLFGVCWSTPPFSFGIRTEYLICDEPGVIYWPGYWERSSEVMWRYKEFLPITLFLAGGPKRPPPLRFFSRHCQTPQDRKLKLGDFSYTFIAHILVKKNCRVKSGQVTRGDFSIPPQKSLQSCHS